MRASFVSVLCAALVGFAFAQEQAPDLTQLLASNSNLSEFSTLLQSYGEIYANLSFQKDVTLFVPSNDAFQKIPYQVLGAAFETNNSDIVRAVLDYHVLQGLHPSGALNGSFKFFPTWLQNTTFTNTSGGAVVGCVKQGGLPTTFVAISGLGTRSTMTTVDLQFNGGLVHVIDTFLVPPQPLSVSANQFNLSAIAAAVQAANLSDFADLTPDLSFFVPTQATLATIGATLTNDSVGELAKFLSYHIVNSSTVYYSANLPNGLGINSTSVRTAEGTNLSFSFADNSVFVNSARIVQEDYLLSNGVLHILDNVLDYNVTNVTPNPSIATQAPVVTGTSLPNNELPFTTILPTTTSHLFSLAPTPTVSSSFGISDVGASTASSYPSETDSALSTKKKKGAADRAVEVNRQSSLSALIGTVLWGLIGLL